MTTTVGLMACSRRAGESVRFGFFFLPLLWSPLNVVSALVSGSSCSALFRRCIIGAVSMYAGMR